MAHIRTSWLLLGIFSFRICSALDFYFDAPSEWKLSEPKNYSPTVRVCFVNPKEGYSPSINLAVEKSTLPLDEYIKFSQKMYQRNPLAKWRDLGSFTSKAGEGKLIEIDLTSQAGSGRILHFIVKVDGEIAVLTAASGTLDLKNNLELFKSSFRSLTATNDLFSLIDDQDDQTKLRGLLSSFSAKRLNSSSSDSLAAQPLELTPEMQQTITQIETLLSKYQEKGACWRFLVLRQCARLLDPKTH